MAHVFSFDGHAPSLGDGCWLAPTATIIGAATIGAKASVWFGAVVRADTMAIVIGARSNIQDNAVVHLTHGVRVSDRDEDGLDPRGVPIGTRIGDDVTVGHGAIIHACTIGDRVLVGMGSIVLDGAIVGRDCIIAAGALVPPRMVIPEGSMVMGNPGRVVRKIAEADRFWSRDAAGMYVGYARSFGDQGIGERR
jgi:carbonic anhydrase/acetyltransferase-like protein (isoleucine patch superfamily)